MTMRSIRVSHILLTTLDLAQTICDMLKEIDDRDLLFKTFGKLAEKIQCLWNPRQKRRPRIS